MSKKTYLGDSVYVEFDTPFPAAITLTTENGIPGDPSNTIVLEPKVAQALKSYIEKHLYPA